MSKRFTIILPALLLPLTASQALAYIGPGAGMSIVGSVLSILATFFVAVGAILFWPVRKYLKRRKARRESAGGGQGRSKVEPDDAAGGGRQA